MGKRWTKEEEDYLRSRAGKESLEDIARELGRSCSSVERKANRLKVLIRRHYRLWTKEEENYLKSKAGKISHKEIAIKLGRSLASVEYRANLLKVSLRLHCKLWTKKEDSCLKKYAGKKPLPEIAKLLERSENGVESRAGKLGLSLAVKRIDWTIEEDTILKELAGVYTAEKIAEKLKRPIQGVIGRANNLGLSLALDNNTSYGERVCKYTFEQIFGKDFIKTRNLDWLVNKNGNKLELDGYCEELGLAFEHQGQFHYSYIEYYHKTKEIFLMRQEMDNTKAELCKQYNIKLFIIPEIGKLLDIKDLKNYILQESKRLKVKLPHTFEKQKFNFSKVYSKNKTEEFIEKAKEVHKDKFDYSKTIYRGSNIKTTFICKEHGEFKAYPSSHLKGKGGCDKCHRNKQKRKVRCIETDVVYNSIAEAGRELNIPTPHIIRVCQKKRKKNKRLSLGVCKLKYRVAIDFKSYL